MSHNGTYSEQILRSQQSVRRLAPITRPVVFAKQSGEHARATSGARAYSGSTLAEGRSDVLRDRRGNELQFSTNLLGHFALTLKLWPALVRANGARVVSVSSMGHRFSDIVWDDVNFERRAYDGWSAYGQSKTANILFAVELDRRGSPYGVRAVSLHPGGIVTGLAKHVPIETLKKMGNVDENGEPVIDPDRDMKSIPQGAATHVWCAVSPDLEGKGGVFCANSDIAELDEGNLSSSLESRDRRTSRVAPYAVSEASAERLWALSEDLTLTKWRS
ncbi:SDR family NAD(P)-dependent oxidoreductase [Rhizobium leguminosarum]